MRPLSLPLIAGSYMRSKRRTSVDNTSLALRAADIHQGWRGGCGAEMDDRSALDASYCGRRAAK
jgi:hypothetical protein